MSDAEQNGRDKTPEISTCQHPGEQPAKKTARQLWEEDEELRKASRPHVVLEMGSKRMCQVGGCGYFSDDDK